MPKQKLSGIRMICITAGITLLPVDATCARAFDVVHAFISAPDGANPDTSVNADKAGNLYNTTLYGGANQ